MYSSIKKALKTCIPKTFLFKNELFFRKIHSLFYLGNKHQCNICSQKLSRFINLNHSDLICPSCGSLSRNRRLWHLLSLQDKTGNWLHFSPSRSLYRTLKKDSNINYHSTDFENEFLANYKFDITNIDQPDDQFDVIICYHILEHIEKDRLAMKELYRVLKPNGTIYIQTPFKDGDIYEDDNITTPEARAEHFGQNDHVRIYSVKGLKSRLERVGFSIEIKTFERSNNDFYNGFISPETILIATKLKS
ncbi:methyltransferase domain-containing protein [Tamlana crocina]|uniref:Methyltransferase domain-containing protein n=1 Tax=Tamlana crocina TaxID=393006 RepID=A0ABX1D8I8_9FLAO|nr:methyltransferase domain-containing protein [Tamlana crocina]NJX14685.1 methyltransferase domain-containing protein [Tamlana crocina]